MSIESLTEQSPNMLNAIMPKIEKYLTAESILLLNTRHDSTILEVPNPSPTEEEPTLYKLCQFIGTIIKKRYEDITEEEYKRFADFINYCVRNKYIGYATLLPPVALKMQNETLLKLYTFSDYNMKELGDKIKKDGIFKECCPYAEGGRPK